MDLTPTMFPQDMALQVVLLSEGQLAQQALVGSYIRVASAMLY